jgi:type IV pilus assembly protein PilN
VIRINLLPPEYEQAQAKREQQVLFGGAGAVIVVFLAAIWMFQARRASALEVKIINAQAELAKFQAIVSQIEKIEQDKTRLTAKRDVIRNLNRSRLIYPVFFEDLLPIVPSDVWVGNIQLVEQGQTMKVTMASNALSNFALATWLTNLQQSRHFSNIDLSAINYSGAGENTGIQTLSFTITCQYQHQGPFPLQEYN